MRLQVPRIPSRDLYRFLLAFLEQEEPAHVAAESISFVSSTGGTLIEKRLRGSAFSPGQGVRITSVGRVTNSSGAPATLTFRLVTASSFAAQVEVSIPNGTVSASYKASGFVIGSERQLLQGHLEVSVGDNISSAEIAYGAHGDAVSGLDSASANTVKVTVAQTSSASITTTQRFGLMEYL